MSDKPIEVVQKSIIHAAVFDSDEPLSFRSNGKMAEMTARQVNEVFDAYERHAETIGPNIKVTVRIEKFQWPEQTDK